MACCSRYHRETPGSGLALTGVHTLAGVGIEGGSFQSLMTEVKNPGSGAFQHQDFIVTKNVVTIPV
jgi:hypothetical protein